MVNVFFYKKRSVNRGKQNNTLSKQNNTHSEEGVASYYYHVDALLKDTNI